MNLPYRRCRFHPAYNPQEKPTELCIDCWRAYMSVRPGAQMDPADIPVFIKAVDARLRQLFEAG